MARSGWRRTGGRARRFGVTGEDDLLTALAHQKPGNTVTLTLNRHGQTVSVRVRLGELSAA